jgi:uncharacterized delta-60 repeat protein
MRTFSSIFKRSGARAARPLAVAALLPAVLLSGVGAAPTMAAGPGAGQLDPTFGKGGKVTVDFGSTLDQADGVALQPDGKILAAGEAWPKPDGQPRFVAVRLNKDGTLDKTFDKDGKVVVRIVDDARDYSYARAVAIQPDGKIVIVGSANNPDMYHQTFVAIRLNKDGSLDKTFDKDGKVLIPVDKTTGYSGEDEAYAVAIQTDGKILIAGSTKDFPSDTAVVRLNKDGSLDKTFNKTGKLSADMGGSDQASAILLQPDGKILVAGRGDAKDGSGDNDFMVARLTADGKLDKTFGKDGLVQTDDYGSNAAYAMVRRPDGKLILGGHANNDNFAVAMYNTDGSLDTTFGEEGQVETDFGVSIDRIYALALQPDGKIVAAGHAATDESDTSNDDMAIVRYTAGDYKPANLRK